MTNEPTDPSTAPDDAQPRTTGGSIRVPVSLAPRSLDEQHVYADSIEAACAWDARLWRRGVPNA